MGNFLEFTGERFIPGVPGEIVYEHWHRYAFAGRFVTGKRVLDVACGEGYGSAFLAARATQVCGIDINQNTVSHAQQKYGGQKNLNFLQGSAAKLSLPDQSIDVVVSFETIEHLPQALQQPMVEEFARVLTADGILIISSPNRPEYSPPGVLPNPYHTHELDREELQTLLSPSFPAQRWWVQRLYFGSVLWQEADEKKDTDTMLAAEIKNMEGKAVVSAQSPAAKYFVVMASRTTQYLPQEMPQLSLFSDTEEKELMRFYHHGREALRLDQLAKDYMEALSRLTLDYQTLMEEETSLRESLNRRDTDLAILQRKFDFRNSWRGWWRFPFSRLRQRLKG